MLESYYAELRKKRLERWIFWSIVLLLAIFLYFFFQGKYLSVNWQWISWTNTGATLSGSSEGAISIRSFGVINIKTTPRDARITIGNEPHYSGEQVYRQYGQYAIRIERDGYLTGSMSALLDDDTNFYIDTVTLLPTPTYRAVPNLSDSSIASIGNNAWIAASESGMTLYEGTFDSGTLILSGQVLDHIGGGKYLSWANIVEYSTLDKKWNPLALTWLSGFLKNCTGTLYRNGLFTCTNTSDIFTLAGKTLTGVTTHGTNFIKKDGSLLLGDITRWELTEFSGTGITSDGNIFVEIEKKWYTASGGTYVSVDAARALAPIETGLDTILFSYNTNTLLISIGKIWENPYLAITDIRSGAHSRVIPFPDIPLEDVRIYEHNGNYLIKTSDALLFLYGQWRDIEWIVHGKILAVGDTFALYETDGAVWEADWEDK